MAGWSDESSAMGPIQGLIIRDRWMDNAVVTADSSAGALPGPVLPEISNLGSIYAFAEGEPDEASAWVDPSAKGVDLLVVTGGGLTGAQDYGGAGYVRRVSGEGDEAWAGLNALTSFLHARSVDSDAVHYAGSIVYSHRYSRLLVARVVDSTTIRIHRIQRDAALPDDDNWTSLDVEVADVKGPADPHAQDTGLALCEVADGSLLMVVNVYRDGLNDLDLYLSTDGGETWSLAHRSLLAVTLGYTSSVDAPSAASWSVCTMLAIACSGDYVRIFFTGRSMGGAFAGLTEGPCTLVSPDRGASWRAHIDDASVVTLTGSDHNPTRAYRAMVGTDTQSGSFLLVLPNNDKGRVYHASGVKGWTEMTSLELDWSDVTGSASTAEAHAVWLTRDPDRIWLHALLQHQGTKAVEMHAWVIDPANHLDPSGWSWWGALERYAGASGAVGLPDRMPYNTASCWADDAIVLYGALVDPKQDGTGVSETGCMIVRAGQWERAPWSPNKNPHGARVTTWWRTSEVMALYFVGTAGDSAQPFEGWAGWMGDPAATGNAFTGTLTPTFEPDHLEISKAAISGAVGSYTFPLPMHLISPYADEDAGAVHAITQVVSSSSTGLTTEHAGIKIVIGSNWTNGLPDPGANVTIRMTTTNFSVWDNGINNSIFSSNYTSGAKIEWRIGFISPTRFEVRWRELGDGTRSDGEWRSSGLLDALAYVGASEGIHVGVLGVATHGSIPTVMRVYEVRIRAGNPCGQAPSGDVLPRDMLGAPLTRGGMHAARGLRVTWGGSGAFSGDAYTATVDHTRGPENLLLDSPRLMWESDDLAERAIVFKAGRSPTLEAARWHVDTIALFGTVDRTAVVEFSDEDSWTTPAESVDLSADLYDGLTVAQVDGAAVRLTGTLPPRGEAVGLFLRFTTGPNAGHTHRIKQDYPAESGMWFQLDGEASAEVYAPGTQAVIYGDRMVWHGDPKRYRYFRVVFPDLSGVPEVVERTGARPGGTATGTHRLGTPVAGTWLPFVVPLDWAFDDEQEGNTRVGRTSSGITWAHTEGPPERTITGRIVGDVDEFRRTLRRLLAAHHEYGRAPAGLVLDAHHPGPETLLLVRWSSGSEQAEAAWYPDEQGRWRTAGDADVVCEEIV